MGCFRLEFAPKIFQKRPPIPGPERLARAPTISNRRDASPVCFQRPGPLAAPIAGGAATSGDPELARFAARMMYSKSGSSPVEEAG